MKNTEFKVINSCVITCVNHLARLPRSASGPPLGIAFPTASALPAVLRPGRLTGQPNDCWSADHHFAQLTALGCRHAPRLCASACPTAPGPRTPSRPTQCISDRVRGVLQPRRHLGSLPVLTHSPPWIHSVPVPLQALPRPLLYAHVRVQPTNATCGTPRDLLRPDDYSLGSLLQIVRAKRPPSPRPTGLAPHRLASTPHFKV